MKLLLVTSRFPFGPKEAFLTEEIAQLAQRFDVIVVPALPTSEPLAVPWLRERAARFRLLSLKVLRLALAEVLHRPMQTARTFVAAVGAPRSIRAKVKNAAIFPTALALARIARRERIDHAHAYWLTTPSTIAFVVSELCGISWSATGHRYDLVDFNVRTEGVPNAGFFPRARFVRAISKQGSSSLAAAFVDGKPPLRMIHLGVALPPEQPVYEKHDVLHLLCAANLEAVKGHETLLRALRIASERVAVRCTIAGDGALRERLERLVWELRLQDRVVFEGVVAHETLLKRMSSREYDVAILTSVDEGAAKREGIPVFLMEAMARGLPVIATRSGAVTEVASDANALLCAPGDADAVARAIVALAQDDDLRRRLADAARKTIEAEFDAAVCARALAAQIGDEPRAHSVTVKGIEIPA
jgi:colanic acid/amylovoran biosynthesis glycosyltransferase